MTKNLFLLAFVFSGMLLFPWPVTAREDTAQITLKKTAISRQTTHDYTVRKGDVISSIIRKIPGITNDDIPDNYRIIKELNPDIADLNKLYAGQVIILPGKSFAAPEDNKTEIPAEESEAYRIKKGDSLIRIIHQELKIKNIDVLKTIKTIQSLNPSIVNPNKIYAGQIIKLPGKTIFVKAPDKMSIEAEEEVKIKEDDKITQEKTVMPAEARLAVIKHVVSQMQGSLTAKGFYYLPIKNAGQVTIDCEKIPVIEFENLATVFLDMDNRANDNLKKVIRESWTNYYLVRVDKKDDVIAILRKIVEATKIYTMTKNDRLITFGGSPVIELMVDWTIAKKDAKSRNQLVQGLRILTESNLLLPKAIVNYAQKSGFAITEFSPETGLLSKPEEVYSLPEAPVLPQTSAGDFIYALLKILGLDATKSVEVKVFDTVKHGFNLSVNADVTIRQADQQYIIFTRDINRQFITVLKEAGNELIFVSNTDSPKIIMEKVLRNLAFNFTSGHFSFSGLEKNQAPFHLSFTGTKIKSAKNYYVVNFEMDQGIRGLLQELWSANVVSY